MGAHVHAYFERKDPATGKWEEITDTCYHDADDEPGDSPFIVRAYNFYYWLGYDWHLPSEWPRKYKVGDKEVLLEAICKPRGFPSDYVPRKTHQYPPNYDKTWLSAEEIIQAKPLGSDDDAGKLCLELQAEMKRLQELYGEVRMVYSFC